MANEENLKPIRTKSEARERGHNGGVKSGEVRRRKKTMKDAAKTLMAMQVPSKGLVRQLELAGVGKDDATYQMAVLVAAMQEAMKGNVNAAKFLRDTMGESPTDQLREQEVELKKDEFKLRKELEQGGGDEFGSIVLLGSSIIGGGYDDFMTSRERYRVLKGSRGSKKSKTAAIDMIYRLINYPESSGLCIRRYGSTLRDSVYADLKWAIHRLGVDAQFTCTTSPLQISRKKTGQKILFRGVDDPLKITSIAVDTGYLCWVWIEEAYEIGNEDDFNKIDLAIRGEVPEGYFKQITLTFNPWSATSWLKPRFFDSPADDVFTKTTTWECNEWLDGADRDVFLRMKENNPRRYRIEGEGEWGIAEGLIFENVTTEEFDIESVRRLPGIKSAFNVDFGFTDPTAFVCEMVDNAAMRIYVFDEWYQTGVTNKEIAEKIKEMGYGGQTIVCDSAEPKSIAELRDEGIRAEASRKGRDSVNHGIQLIQNYQIVVHPRCTEFLKEISNYCWAKDAKTGKLLDRPDHEFSHGMDSMRYGVTRVLMPDAFSFD